MSLWEYCADLSAGHVYGLLEKPGHLLKLISAEDGKMDDMGRRGQETPVVQPQMKNAEYSVEEIRTFLQEMSGRYDLARVVDPVECRILEFAEDGRSQ